MFKKYHRKGIKRIIFRIIFLYIMPTILIIFYLANLDINKISPCEEIISYKIGVFDPKFGITQEEFKNNINQATEMWRKASGYTLFGYNPNGDLTINLIYDTRQETTQKEQVLDNEIVKSSKVADSVKQELKLLQEKSSLKEQEYESQLASFKQMQSKYNSEVEYWNNKGGVPNNEYDKLESEKENFINKEKLVEEKRLEINELSDEINVLIDKYFILFDRIELNENIINNNETGFDKGSYVRDENGTKIDLYHYENKTDFLLLIAHELGHALELDHNSNRDSVMYFEDGKEDFILSPEDIQDLTKRCELE